MSPREPQSNAVSGSLGDAGTGVTVQEQIIMRLDADAYKQLCRELGNLSQPAVSDKTTDLQAGVLLGVQITLQKLREGFVIAK